MSLDAVARVRADASGETDLDRRRGYLRMVRRFMTRFGVALSVAAVVLSLGAGAAFGGEVTGNGKPLWTKSLGAPTNPYGHAASLAVGDEILVADGELARLGITRAVIGER